MYAKYDYKGRYAILLEGERIYSNNTRIFLKTYNSLRPSEENKRECEPSEIVKFPLNVLVYTCNIHVECLHLNKSLCTLYFLFSIKRRKLQGEISESGKFNLEYMFLFFL